LTQRFLTPDGAWTTKIDRAKNFPNMREMLTARQKFKLQKVEAVFMIGSGQGEIEVHSPLDGD
jgi:hypothetical protein